MIDHATTVRLTVALTAASKRAAGDLLEALRFLVRGTRLESGCRGCFAWMDPDASVHYVEDWETEDDARRHIGSPHFVSLLAVMESSQESPRVQFDFVAATRGLDYVEQVRRDHQG